MTKKGAWITNLHNEHQDRLDYHEAQGHIIDEPQPVEGKNVRQMIALGMVGVYEAPDDS